jgi:hypothetical protein
MFVIFTNYRERIVVAQNRVIISRGIIRIAHMVRSSHSTGIKRRATTCSRVPIHHRSTETCTTSSTGRKTTFLKTRPTRPRRILLCPSLHLHLVRLIRLPNPRPRLYLQEKFRLLRPIHIHQTPGRSPFRIMMGPCPRLTVMPLTPKWRRPSQRQRQVAIMRTMIIVLATTTTTITNLVTMTGTAPAITTKARTSKSKVNPPSIRVYLLFFSEPHPSFSEPRAVHPSWNYLRESERAEEHALRRAWGAHHRRSVDH